MTVISKSDLRRYVWLAQEVRQAKHTPKLEALGFNYFAKSRATGKPVAMKLTRLNTV